jgi:hypothetical protein
VAGWTEAQLLTVKVLHGHPPSTLLTTREIILTFINPATARDFVAEVLVPMDE